VGTISSSVSVGASSAVHPHGRGDNSVVARQKHLAFGSPPRAWGQYSADDGADRPVRFTPTGVGTMPRARPRSRPSAVHPHGRGDNGSPPETDRPSIGSPPRAWGQYRAQFDDDIAHRFTPTGVGTIIVPHTVLTNAAVHPHGRGDNAAALARAVVGYGSPPRAWGQLLDNPRLRCYSRFTPTGVGTMA